MHARRVPFAILLTAFLAIAAACGSSEPTPAPNTDAAYFEEIRGVIGVATGAQDRFDELMGPVFPDFAPDDAKTFVLLNALREQKFSESTNEMVTRLDAIEPPDRFAEEHESFLGLMRTLVEKADMIEQSIEAEDIPRIVLIRAEMQAAQGRAVIVRSPEFCHELLADVPDFRDSACQRESIIGDAYASSVDLVVREFIAEFGPRASLQEGMTEDQVFRTLTYVQPAIVATLEGAVRSMEALEPPADYATGHEVLTDLFDQLLSTARAIDRAVADGDGETLQREFVRSQNAAETARERMPENFRPIVQPIFGE